jgi:hypothetical protein
VYIKHAIFPLRLIFSKESAAMFQMMQSSLFSWQDVELSTDLQRFKLALRSLKAGKLVAALDEERKGRRDDYPNVVMWRCILAGLFFCIDRTSDLMRELQRNGELRQVCGMDPLAGGRAVPSAFAFSRFLLRLAAHQDLLDEIFRGQVEQIGKHLPDLGRQTAVDSKALLAHGVSAEAAAEGVKTQTGADGRTQFLMKWLGYKLHLLCDATHELPLAFEVTPANVADSPKLLPLVEQFEEHHPELAERMETLAADRGYDDGADKKSLHDDHGVLPVIPARDLHKGQHQALNPERHDTTYLSPVGEVCCKINPFADKPEEQFCAMQFQGFESERGTLKFRCPAAAFGITCKNQDACRSRTKDQGFGRVVRVDLNRDRRLLGPLYPHGETFTQTYKARTGIERLFYRLDHLFGFERISMRSLAKARVLVTLGLSAMLATAASWIRLGQTQKIRCRLQAVA